MVDFVQGEDGGEFFVHEGVHDLLDGFVFPVLQRLLDGEPVEGAGDDGPRGAVAGELALQGVDVGGFDGGVAAFDAAPFLHQVAEHPVDDLAAQPDDVVAGVVAPGGFAVGVRGAAHVDDVDQGVGVAEVVEEFVPEAFALVCAGDEPCHVEQLDGHGADALLAGAVVGLASLLQRRRLS